MNVVGKVGSLISQGVYSVATPFHPFGGAVDVIVVEQQDGTYRSTPWYVRFGKFQGVLKGSEKVVRIHVNGVEAGFHMYLDNSGEAYFVTEILSGKNVENVHEGKNPDILEGTQDGKGNGDNKYQIVIGPSNGDGIKITEGSVSLSMEQSDNGEIENERKAFAFHNEQPFQASPVGSQGYGAYQYEGLDQIKNFVKSQGSDSEVVLVSVDGFVLTAPISSCNENTDNVQLSTPQFHLGPSDGTELTIEQLQGSSSEDVSNGEDAWAAGLFRSMEASTFNSSSEVFHPPDGDGGVSASQLNVCKDARAHAYQVQETPSAENTVDGLGMDSSEEDINVSFRREETFRSCLELSELFLDSEDGDLQDRSSLFMRFIANGGTDLSLPSMEGTSARDGLECRNCARENHHDSESSTVCCSSVVHVQMEAPDNDRLVDESMDSMGSQSISVHNSLEQKDEALGAAHDSQGCGSSQHMFAAEEVRTESLAPQSGISDGGIKSGAGMGFELSLCGNFLRAGMGLDSANEAFNAHRLSEEEFKVSSTSIIKNEKLIVRYKDRYMTWEEAAPIILGMAAFGLDFPAEVKDAIPIEQNETPKVDERNAGFSSSPSRRWRLWPIPFRRISTLQHSNSNSSSEDVFVDSESFLSPRVEPNGENASPKKQFQRTNIPSSEQIASLNLNEGQNLITFSFSTRVLGKQQVDAHIYLWKWNARIVISDVDGTITKSDVLGQFMPLVGKDWTQSGVARLFSAIKENGYQLLFLSARAIVQAYLTRSFLLNLKQDGKALPNGPVVISPDGLFPSLYREVIRRAPHEFKIACLQDIRALFPTDYNPFYAGFGNRDTDELSYRKIGIPKGKIFIINPKGEVAINNRIDVKSYTSLHTLVNDMFPPTSLAEQEDFNSWNYWKVPLSIVDG